MIDYKKKEQEEAVAAVQWFHMMTHLVTLLLKNPEFQEEMKKIEEERGEKRRKND